MKNTTSQQLLIFNIAMVFLSASGALGRSIQLSPILIIWSRCLLAGIIMLSFCFYKRYSFRINSRSDLLRVVLASLFMTIHWVLYFYSLQLTNVAVGMLTLFSYPLFTTILEPLFFKIKWSISHLISSVAVLLGLFILFPSFDIQNEFVFGMFMGLLSSLAYTSRNLLLKTQVAKYNGSVLMTYQIVFVVLVLLPFIGSLTINNLYDNALPLITLALVTTSIGHTLFLMSFKNFSISTASILSSLQPVYGIIIAFLFLNEVPDSNSIWGGGLIVAAVMYTGWSLNKK